MKVDLHKRSLAPIVDEAWKLIDEEATRVLKQNLAGRQLVDFKGPYGWDYSASNLGRLKILTDEPVKGVFAGLREVLPLVEIRTPIVLSQMELDLVARGCDTPDLSVVVSAAEKIALAEDTAIFNGYSQAGMTGILEAATADPVVIDDVSQWPEAILQAKEKLRKAGITGPYAVAMGTRIHNEFMAATMEGYPIAKQIQRQIIEGPIVHVPSISDCVLLSVRGGDFELVVGHDLSIGYAGHDKDSVELFLTESFAFRVLEPAAAVRLKRT